MAEKFLTAEQMTILRRRASGMPIVSRKIPVHHYLRQNISIRRSLCRWVMATCCGKPNLCRISGNSIDAGDCEICTRREKG